MPPAVAGLLGFLAVFISVVLNNESSVKSPVLWVTSIAIGVGAAFGRRAQIKESTRSKELLDHFEQQMPCRARDETIVKLLERTSSFLPNGFPFRANVMIPDDKGVCTIKYPYNMDTDADLTIELMPGEGCTGEAIKNKRQVYGEPSFQRRWYVRPSEMAKVNPDMKWILSTPIARSDNPAEVFAVYNIDSTREVDKKTLGELFPAARDHANLIGKVLEKLLQKKGG